MSQPTTFGSYQAADAPKTPGEVKTQDLATQNGLLSSNSGASAPSYATEGSLWKKTSGGLYLRSSTGAGSADTLFGDLLGNRSAVALATATADTLLIASLLKRAIYRTGPTAAYGDTTDTAANIVAAIPDAEVGMGFEFTIVNTVAFANTLAAGVGVTLAGVTSIAASYSRRYLCELTNVGLGTEAVTITGLFTAAN